MGVKLRYRKGVYKDAEDSWLLQEQVRKLSTGKKVLDMGTGTGIQAITAAKAGAKEVIAVDIHPVAVQLAKENAKLNKVKIKVIQSNLFENVKGKFDLIIFNVPYLPPEKPKDLAWSGGKKFIEKFLKQAKNYLTKHGKIIFVFSSLTKLKNLEIIAEKKLPFEQIYVGILYSNNQG